MDVSERDLWVVLITLIGVGIFAVCFAIWRSIEQAAERQKLLDEADLRLKEYKELILKFNCSVPEDRSLEAPFWKNVRRQLLPVMEKINEEFPILCIELMPYWETIRSDSSDRDTKERRLDTMWTTISAYRGRGIERTAVKEGRVYD